MRWLSSVVAFLWLGCSSPEPPRTEMEDAAEPGAAEPVVHGRRFRTEPIVHGETLVIPRATVCVPPVEDDSVPLPVLYALDGDYFVGRLSLCDVVDQLVADRAIPPWVVVSVGSTERRTETLAARPERLSRVVIDELEPLVRAQVALADGRDARAVIGYSYGGLAAVRFSLARPNDFGRVIAMSPSLWFGGRSTLAAFRGARVLPMRVYVDAGAREGDEGEVIPYMIDDARTLVGIARARGMRFGRDVALREVPRTGHDMALAAARLPGALRFVLGAQPTSDVDTPAGLSIDVFERTSPRAPTTFSIDATYADDVVLSWPIDLAHARLGSRPLDDARLPASPGPLSVEVGGMSARRP